MSDDAPHIPVLLTEMVDSLAPQDDETFVDGTFGAGGYTKAILARAACRVIAIDRDPSAVERGRELAKSLDGRLDIIEGIRGARMAVRYCDHHPLGLLRHRVFWHDCATENQTDLYLKLVLWRFNYRHRDAAHR